MATLTGANPTLRRDFTLLALATTGVIDRSAAQYVTTAFETVETASIAISQDLKPVAEMQVAAAGIEALNAKAVAAAQALQSKISNQLKLGSSAPLLLCSLILSQCSLLS